MTFPLLSASCRSSGPSMVRIQVPIHDSGPAVVAAPCWAGWPLANNVSWSDWADVVYTPTVTSPLDSRTESARSLSAHTLLPMLWMGYQYSVQLKLSSRL